MKIMEDDAVPTSDSEKENIEKEDDIETKEGEGEGKASGFMNNLLPRIVFGGEAEKKEVEKEDEEQRGGFITHLISSLVSPRSSKTGEVSEKKFEDSKSEDLGSNGNGHKGNMVLNLFNHNKNEGGVKETEEMDVNEARKRLKTEKKGEEGGYGIIDNIVSHFPPSIPDDAVPTSDEAFILINSIIRD